MVFPNGLHVTTTGETVDEDVSLNNSWDIIDRDFSSLVSGSGVINPGSIISPVQTLQWINNDGVWRYYDGAAWQPPAVETFGAWTNFPTLLSPYISRPGSTAQYRISNLKTVEFRGGIQSGAAADPPPDTGTYIKVSNTLPTALIPAFTREVFGVAANSGAAASTNEYIMGQIMMVNNAGAAEMHLLAQGKHATGNFYSLDGVRYTAA